MTGALKFSSLSRSDGEVARRDSAVTEGAAPAVRARSREAFRRRAAPSTTRAEFARAVPLPASGEEIMIGRLRGTAGRDRASTTA